jgi:ketosteroid isomerase-like protein
MSPEHVQLTYRAHAAFNRRDLHAYLEFCHPEMEFVPYEVSVHGGEAYRGHAGVRTWWEDSLAVLPDLRSELDEVRDAGTRVFVRGRLFGRGAESGASFERPLWQAVEWRGERLIWWQAFGSETEALAAAGL